jgi:hypothetical protein
MTFYEANPDVKPVGAEVAEFDDSPTVTGERPWPGQVSRSEGDDTTRPGKPSVEEAAVDGDVHTFAIRFARPDGAVDGCIIVISGTAASIWGVSEREAAATLAGVIDTSVPRPLPTAFRFASDTVPPSLPLAAVCQEMATGRWSAFVTRRP